MNIFVNNDGQVNKNGKEWKLNSLLFGYVVFYSVAVVAIVKDHWHEHELTFSIKCVLVLFLSFFGATIFMYKLISCRLTILYAVAKKRHVNEDTKFANIACCFLFSNIVLP